MHEGRLPGQHNGTGRMLLGLGTVGMAIGSVGVGIPQAVTRAGAATGAHMVAVDLPQCSKAGLELENEIRAAGGKIDFHAADAADFDAMRPVFESARKLGPIAAVFCVAGKADPVDNHLLPAIRAGNVMKLFDESVRNNAKTALVPMSLALPYMIEDGGGVIEFFDSLNSIADLGQIFYTSGKAPLSKWCRLISREFGRFGVRSYNLVIGTTPSKKESWLKRFMEMVGLEKALEWLFDTRRLGRPEDIAEMAINLCTHNFWMSGNSIDLHGGYCGVPLTDEDNFRAIVHRLHRAMHDPQADHEVVGECTGIR